MTDKKVYVAQKKNHIDKWEDAQVSGILEFTTFSDLLNYIVLDVHNGDLNGNDTFRVIMREYTGIKETVI